MLLREDIVPTKCSMTSIASASPKMPAKRSSAPAPRKIKQQEENERMAKLYRQHVLKEQPGEALVQLGGIAPAAPAAPAPKKEAAQEEVGSFGD